MAENISNLIDPNASPKSSPSTSSPQGPKGSTKYFTKIENPYESLEDYQQKPLKKAPPPASQKPLDNAEEIIYAQVNKTRKAPKKGIPQISTESDGPPELPPRPQEYFDNDKRPQQAKKQPPPTSPGNQHSMSSSVKKPPLPPTAQQIDTGLGRPPPTPPSPKKSTLGCPQAIMQWYMRQKMWVKIALAFGAIAILFGLGGLIYCAAEDCWGSGDGDVETTDIVRISMKSTMAKPITSNSNKLFKSTVSMQPKSVTQRVTGREDTEITETTEATEGTKGSQIPSKPGVTGATTSSVGTIKVLLALVIVVAAVVALIVIYNKRKSAIIKTGAHR